MHSFYAEASTTEEPDAGKPHVRVCAGGRWVTGVPTVRKKSILHRKNSLFYKTQHGAYVGDLFMSLIHTCSLCSINPFDYLKTLQMNKKELFAAPEKFLPWNYQKNTTA